MILIEGIFYDFPGAWKQIGRSDEAWRQQTLVADLEKLPLDKAPFPDLATPDYPFDPQSFWRTASSMVFLNHAYQSGQGYPFSQYGSSALDGDDLDRFLADPAESAYRAQVYEAAESFIRKKAAVPMWVYGAGAAALALILFRR